MNINQMKENKLRTILQFSIPSIIAMLLETVITITDGYFYRVLPDYVVLLSTYDDWNCIWDVPSCGWETTGLHDREHCWLYIECYPGFGLSR